VHTGSLAAASYNYQRRWAAARRVVPRRLRRALRLCYFLTLDGVDLCLGRRSEMVPPRWRNPVGDGDFEATGTEFLDYFVRLGGLKPTDRVLDVGCGIGRMARPLTKYLTTGSYEGFDIVPAGIEWCQKTITARYPGFRFSLADARNPEYNPHGKVPATKYRFPYGDAQFDFAFLTSVFTHMRPSEVSRYLSELERVLTPGGKCLATFFVLNDESHRLVASGRSSIDLKHPLPGCWTSNLEIPETAIGYGEQELERLTGEQNLALRSLHCGNWCGRADYLSFQDIAILEKRPQAAK
jgi:SAM-dependent methyltransferase